MNKTAATPPSYVTALETAFGPPSDAGFGSAVFFSNAPDGRPLEEEALSVYRSFVGKLWERWGEEAWMGPWREVHDRSTSDGPSDLATELRGMEDRDAARSVGLVLDLGPEALAALSTAFDEEAVDQLKVFNIGDGGAMAGLLIAARRSQVGETICLVVLLD